MNPWWLVLILLAAALSPFYAFVIAKCVGAGWTAGVSRYIRNTYERKRRDGKV